MTEQMRYTKTFTETTCYRRDAVVQDSVVWQRLASNDVPIDQQIRNWVDQTGSIIQHPGQLGVHMQWLDVAQTTRMVTIGLTVLYTEGASHAGDRPGEEDAASKPGGSGEGANRPAAGSTRTRTARIPASARIPVTPELLGQLNAVAGQPAPHVASIYQPGAPRELQPNGLVCPACGQLQLDSPSGPVCPNGHGGLEGIPAPAPRAVPRPSRDPFQ